VAVTGASPLHENAYGILLPSYIGRDTLREIKMATNNGDQPQAAGNQAPNVDPAPSWEAENTPSLPSVDSENDPVS
jgi:hypothetical protein